MMSVVASSLRPASNSAAFKSWLPFAACTVFGLLLSPVGNAATNAVGVADAPLEAQFYSDASCLLTISTFVQPGKTIINADVDANGSRMFIHCDTEDGRRLTLLARGDSLDTESRAALLNRTQIADGEHGMLAWLTRTGVNYSDDTAPRRYIIGGSVKMRKSPAVDAVATTLNSSAHAFASINGVLEPIVKSEAQSMQMTPTEDLPVDDAASKDESLLTLDSQEIDTSNAETSNKEPDKVVR